MEKQLILVPSVTYAMKAKRILDRYKIRSYIERTPKTHQVYSCGYCVFVPENVETANQIEIGMFWFDGYMFTVVVLC